MGLYRRLFFIFCAFIAVMLVGATGMKLIVGDRYSFADCVYNAIILVATVERPFSTDVQVSSGVAFKVFTAFLLIGGMGTILYGVSAIAALIIEGELTYAIRRRRMENRIKELRDHFIVCGMGETGYYIAEELSRIRVPFVAIESSEQRIERLKSLQDVLYIVGDATDDAVLEKAGIRSAAGVIIALPGDKENLFVTVTARQLNPRAKIVAKGIDPRTDDKLLRAGADKVVSPPAIGAFRMVSEMVRPSVVTFLEKMMRDPEEVTRIEEMTVAPGCDLADKTLSEARLANRVGVLVLAIKPPDSTRFIYRLLPEAKLVPGTIVVIIGEVENVKKARALAGMPEDSTAVPKNPG